MNCRPAMAVAIQLFAAGAALAQAGQANNAAPVGHWRLDEFSGPSIDSSGNSLNSSAWPAGVSANSSVNAGFAFQNPLCLSLAGSPGFVSIPNDAKLQITGDVSISFWVYPAGDAAGAAQGLVTKGSFSSRTYGVWRGAGTAHNIQFQCTSPAGASLLDLSTADGSLPNDAWTHVTCTISGASAVIYLDGVSSATGTRTGTPGVTADPLTFGHANYDAQYFIGRLDDVRIYNRALSAAEVAYLAGGGGPPGWPTELIGMANANTTAGLSWTPAPSSVPVTYSVWRSTWVDPYTVIGTSTTPLYTDATVEAGGGYFYRVSSASCGGQGLYGTLDVFVEIQGGGTPYVPESEEAGICATPGTPPSPAVVAGLAALLALGLLIGRK